MVVIMDKLEVIVTTMSIENNIARVKSMHLITRKDESNFVYRGSIVTPKVCRWVSKNLKAEFS